MLPLYVEVEERSLAHQTSIVKLFSIQNVQYAKMWDEYHQWYIGLDSPHLCSRRWILNQSLHHKCLSIQPLRMSRHTRICAHTHNYYLYIETIFIPLSSTYISLSSSLADSSFLEASGNYSSTFSSSLANLFSRRLSARVHQGTLWSVPGNTRIMCQSPPGFTRECIWRHFSLLRSIRINFLYLGLDGSFF